MQDAPAIGLPAIRSPLAAVRHPVAEIRSLPERSGSRAWLDSLKEEINPPKSTPSIHLDSTILHASPAANEEAQHHRSRDHSRTAMHKGQPSFRSFEGSHLEWLGEALRRPAPPSCGLRM